MTDTKKEKSEDEEEPNAEGNRKLDSDIYKLDSEDPSIWIIIFVICLFLF